MGIPEAVEASLSVVTDTQKGLIKELYEAGQGHLFDSWTTDTDEAVRKGLASQLEALDGGYSDGGLTGYISNAKKLLEDSAKGVNPLAGWEPSVPQGELFELGTPSFNETEEIGIKELGSVGFVLVAGGLGERLGYSGIKIALPTEMSTETCYLQYYAEYILAVQAKYAKKGKKLPLCIMTSGDTNSRTVALLEECNYFGLQKSQVVLVQQGQGVPALLDNNATIALNPDDPSKVLTKPHGHGDIHELLYRHGVAKKWVSQGLKWLVLFQDTNGLAFHTLPLMLGVSSKLNLIMNSLTVPRKAKQAIGAITQLKKTETGEMRTINVEYNQLDPLLRASGYPEGDVNDEKTGFSPFPGNINQLLFHLESYSATLDKTKGLMPEFVNPKYKDDTKTTFKKPTRLECMMQDFPTVLTGDDAKRAGFTSIAADICFSPVKNATAEGVKLQEKGTHPATAASGEADQLNAFRKMMKTVGCKVEEAPAETYSGITVVLSPAVVLKPNFCACPADYKVKFPTPEQVKISPKSTLIVNGSGVTIKSLDLDGALVIDCPEGQTMEIEDKTVKNDGWVRVKDENSDKEIIKMRGYHVEKKETAKMEGEPTADCTCVLL